MKDVTCVIRQISIAIPSELVKRTRGKRAHNVYVSGVSVGVYVFGMSITFTEYSVRNARKKRIFTRDAPLHARSNERAHVDGRIFVRSRFITFCSRRARRCFSPSLPVSRLTSSETTKKLLAASASACENKSRAKESNLALNART